MVKKIERALFDKGGMLIRPAWMDRKPVPKKKVPRNKIIVRKNKMATKEQLVDSILSKESEGHYSSEELDDLYRELQSYSKKDLQVRFNVLFKGKDSRTYTMNW